MTPRSLDRPATPTSPRAAGRPAGASARRAAVLSLAALASACAQAADPGAEVEAAQEIRNGDPASGPAFNGIGDLLATSSAEACTGSLISKSVVLTAAQCLVGSAPGRTFALRRTRTAPAVATRSHPGFDTPDGLNLAYDVALVRLDRSATNPWAGVTRYSIRGTEMPTLVHATGVGFGESGQPGVSRRSGDFLVTQYIGAEVAAGAFLPDAFLEVQPGSAKKQMFCTGDQGGPLLYGGQIAGTASFRSVATCLPDDGPGYYVSMARFAAWIAQNLDELDPPGACPREDDAALATRSGGCTDLAAGLAWSAPGAARLSWPEAGRYCDQLTEAGFGDWRLATLAELGALDAHRIVRRAGFRQPDPALAGQVWSSTSAAGERAWAWDFDAGRSRLHPAAQLLRPLCVRTPTTTVDRCLGVTCAASDQCHAAGACDPATGLCSNPALPDGTACRTANTCTRGDSCSAGVCTLGAGCDANASCSSAGCACNPQYSGDGFTCTHVPVDCVLSDWSAFSDCSASCGGGTQTRSRTIVTPPAYGGAACGPLVETAACNLQPCTVPPVITAQPADQAVDEGLGATFSAAATGTPPLFWQWRRRAGPLAPWADLAGATGPTLTTGPTVAATDSGAQFSVVVTNGAGSDTSAAATLTVNPFAGPVITAQPADATVASGATATFTVAATGVPAPTYQWQSCPAFCSPITDIPGATAATLTLPAVAFADSTTQYLVVVKNRLGAVTSNPAKLTVVPQPLTGFDQITTGYSHTLLLKGGRVWSMGNNEYGELGHPPSPGRDSSPRLVEGLPGPVAKVLARGQTSYAILTDGTVWTWGYNSYGQLGNPSVPLNGSTVVPVPVLRESDGLPLDGIVDLVVSDGGSWGGAPTAIGLTAAGAAWVWGSNYAEPNTGLEGVHLGGAVLNAFDGSTPQVTIEKLALATGMGLAIMGDGALVYWWRVQAGMDTKVYPVPNSGTNVIDVAASYGTTWFITGDGQVFWFPSYTVYTGPALVPFNFPVDWISAGAAGDVNFAHDKVTGALYAWGGANTKGEFGSGTTGGGNNQPGEAVQVLLVDDATQVTAGEGYALALRPGGAVWGWGSSEWGALGTTGSIFGISTPYPLTGP